MRSVFIYFREAGVDEVSTWLTSNCKYQGENAPWLVLKAEDPVLYINIEDGVECLNKADEHGYADEYKAVVASFGHKPSVVLSVDVSGRHDGTQEVEWLVKNLLALHRGYAQDDYSDHLWTHEELIAGAKFLGHRFFDFKDGRSGQD